mmetsp:Transcript_11159/g.22834  ORF Transcript_11159/g.22834 Transcript_11159/m.22834 type:complete len:624 (+) Transcript_11159:127-1998(+)
MKSHISSKCAPRQQQRRRWHHRPERPRPNCSSRSGGTTCSTSRASRVSAGLAAAVAAALAATAASVPVCDAFVGRSTSSSRGAARTSAPPLFATRSSSRAQPQVNKTRYVRIEPKGAESQGSNKKRRYEIQTAVTTFTKVDPATGKCVATVDLHSQLHFGTPAYYSYYNDPIGNTRSSSYYGGADDDGFATRYDRTHYELVVSQDMIDARSGGDGGIDTCSPLRRIRPMAGGLSPVMASPADQSTARAYDLRCQADMINYAQPNWVNADLTREEFVAETQKVEAAVVEGRANDDSRFSTLQQQQQKAQQQEPLWALASTAAVYPGSELVSALLRPSTPSTGSGGSLGTSVTRRLFSNLFLPGDALAGLIRAILWLAVPAPEVSVMLLDWSSLSPKPTGGISPIALPVMECLLSGNVGEARKLVFGQMVVSGQAADASIQRSGGSSSAAAESASVLIGKRNERAIDVLQTSIERDGCQRNALLYGASHCLDLQRRLEGLGFVPVKTEWRTAWSVDVPPFGLGRGGKNNANGSSLIPAFVSDLSSSSASNGIAVALVVLPLYLAVGGFDWVATIGEVGGALGRGEVGDGILEAFLYLVRHVALYLGLAKFVIEWDGQNTLFGGES